MYDQFASDYDHFVDWENRLAFEMPFIEKTLASVTGVRGKPAAILDAACGTGMHAISLAAEGYAVSAADLSGPMIEQARANAATSGVQVHFKAAGFGNLAERFGREKFSALLCLGNSLPHLLTEADLQKALADFKQCLCPGGIVLIQNRNFDAVMANRQRWMEPQSFQDEHLEWLFQRFYDFESDGTIRFNIVTLVRPHGGEWQTSAISTRLLPQRQGDLQQALQQAGFSDICLFGSMRGESFDPVTSSNLVIIAHK